MELRAFAEDLVRGREIADKLRSLQADHTDETPGPALRIAAPGRPDGLEIGGPPEKVPPLSGMHDRAQRVRIVHALANHELQAIELFAWALLAFPDTPREFRAGLAGILADEQRHFRMYAARLSALGARFGDHRVTSHFWKHIDAVKSPLSFVCTMALTFENANLDFANEHAIAARAANDEGLAEVLEKVHADEVRHVGFGWRWLETLKDPDETHWDAYRRSIAWPLRPERARGGTFDEQARVAAGFDRAFIEHLEATRAERPGGPLR